MADLTELQSAMSTKIVGADLSGLETNAVNADSAGNLYVRNTGAGPVTPGTAASASELIGGQYNAVLPVLATGQQAAIQIDSSGRIIIRPLTSTDVVSAVQSGTWNIGTIASITNPVAVTQSGTWTVQPGNTANTTPWLVTDSSDGAVAPGAAASKSSLAGGVYNSTLPTVTSGQQVALQVDASGRLLVSASASPSGAVDKSAFTYGATVQQVVGGVYQDTSPTLTAGTQGAVRLTANRAMHVNIRDSSGNEKLGQNTMANSIPVVLASDQSSISVTGVVSASDVLNGGGVNGAITVGLTAVEAKVGASVLTNRAMLTVFHNGNGKLYWGYANTVTTANGTQIFKNTTISWPVGVNTHVWLIADTAGQDIRVTEAAD